MSLRQLRASWGRTGLVVGGISTGVALIVAIQVINASVLANFRRTLELIAGPAALEVTLGVGEVGFLETALATVRADPDVSLAVPLVRGTVARADAPSEALQLFGADLTTEDDLASYQIALETDRGDILVWLNDPRSIALPAAYASAHGIEVGQRVKLTTPRGMDDFTVRGLLRPQGLARAFGGQLAVMDLPAAQILLGKDGRLDQIDVVLRPPADVAVVRDRLERALPPELTVARPAQRGAMYESVLSAFQWMLTGLSLLCLVAGAYIIYNTTSTGASHRALVLATLQVIGADSRQLFRLLMLEALLLGMVGAALGVGVGIGLARLLVGMVSDSMGVIFQLRFPVDSLTIAFSRQLQVAAAGVVTALFASYFAARRITRLDPLSVMRADVHRLTPRLSSRRMVLAWAALVLVAALALVLEVRFRSVAWGNFGSTLWFAASIVIAIPLVTWAGNAVSRVLVRYRGAEGRVAAESLLRSPARSGVTVAAITLVLSVAVMCASVARSHRQSVSDYYLGGFLACDLMVSAVATEGGWLESPIPEAVATRLQAIPGVHSVDTIRILPGQMYRGERIAIAGGSDGLADPARYPSGWYREGDAAAAAPLLRNGEGANVSTSFADRFGVHVGDRIELDTPTGALGVQVVGVVPDYISDRGTVILARHLLVRRWGDSLVNRIQLFLEPGADVEEVRQRAIAELGDRYLLKALTMKESVDYLTGKIAEAYAFTYAIQLLIVIVTIAGVFDLLLASIWERRRELALWRVIGADERTVRRSVVLESGTIGALGGLLGIPVGLVSAWMWARINYRYLLGYYVDFHFALGTAVWSVALAVTMAVFAGYLAARLATRQSVLEGIQVE